MKARGQAIEDFKKFLRKDETSRANKLSAPTPLDPQDGAPEMEGVNPDPFSDDHLAALEELLGRK